MIIMRNLPKNHQNFPKRLPFFHCVKIRPQFFASSDKNAKKTSLLLQEWVQLFFLLWATVGLLQQPQASAKSVQDGLSLCFQVIIPALFPFFILSSLVIDLGFSHRLGNALSAIMPPLFAVNGNGATALVLGLVGGYPVGAKTVVQLYQTKACSKIEAQRLLAFTNNAGPAFVLGVVGLNLLGNKQLAWVVYGSHVLSAILVGLLFRFYHPQEPCSTLPAAPPPSVPFLPAFLSAVSKAMESTLQVCSFLLCFSVILQLLSQSVTFSPFGISPYLCQSLLTGFFELSSAIQSLHQSPSLPFQVALSSLFLGWAGLSIHCQVLSCVRETDLSLTPYFCGKLLQSLFSALLALGWMTLFF